MLVHPTHKNAHNCERAPEEAHYCTRMVLLLQQHGLYLLTCVVWNFNIVRLHFYDESEGDWQLKYELDIQNFVLNKLSEDGTLVPKHVGVGT
jgi:hypothetical protein